MAGSWLTPDLAQRIVDRTREVIDYNINIRDRQGSIIASGQEYRIGTRSELAAEGIARNEVLEVSSEEAVGDAGMEPGVQIPINFRGEIIGAVDITGHPAEVRDYVGLVRMTAELMLQQAYYLRRLRLEERREEQFIRRLLQEEEFISAAGDGLEERARELGYSPEAEHLVWVFAGEDLWSSLVAGLGAGEDISAAEQEEQVRDELRQFFSGRDLKMINLEIDSFVVVEDVSGSSPGEEGLLQRGRDMIDFLNENLEWQYRLGVGSHYTGLSGIRRSYQEGEEAVELGGIFYPERSVCCYDDLQLEKLVSSLPNSERERLAGPFPLEDKFQRCLQEYFRSDLNVSRTAENLALHRNSVRYRLERVGEITGLDTGRWEELILLKLGMLAHLYEKNRR